MVNEQVSPPTLFTVEEWEWREESEDMGLGAVYDQIADLASYVRSIRVDIHKLGGSNHNDSNVIQTFLSMDSSIASEPSSESSINKKKTSKLISNSNLITTPNLPKIKKNNYNDIKENDNNSVYNRYNMKSGTSFSSKSGSAQKGSKDGQKK